MAIIDENSLYSDIYNRLLDWMSDVANTGGNVSNRARDLLNRAQEQLRIYRAWDGLLKRSQLTVTDKVATLPDDCREIVRVWHDSDSDGKPDFYYYQDSKRPDDGYYITDTFAKATGHTRTMTFYAAPSYDPYVEYIHSLDEFTGDGTEYSYFPGELLLATAQLIHVTESGIVGNEYSAIERRQSHLMLDYEQSHQYQNIDPRSVQNDDDGVEIELEDFNLYDGAGGIVSHFDNDYDLRG